MSVDYKSFIIQDPAEILHSKCKKVTDFKEAKKIANKLIEVTRKVETPLSIWLGMAAPQIGFDKRVILLRKSNNNYQIMTNPEIIRHRWVIPIFSRCFSVKGIYIIKSPYWIKVKYQDLDGKLHEDIIKGGKAATLMQEINHIDGILISDIGFRIL